ncbi:MAG: hybrid sensor histidine kinase/response regulator [Bacteroidetes bacterium]|nr:hybrid sensor histidine kinase/response regulator [Bacteroidota bacterium]
MENENVLSNNTSNVLIVDDISDNLKVLGNILKNEGYKVRPVPNGALALQVANKETPDIILLDIMMPDMDGYEVCRQLKQNPILSDIPVIFISALNDTNDIVKAFTSGGVDYITKPFQAEEVKARVATHLKIRQQKQKLQQLNAEKVKFFSIIAHDLRGPLGGLMMLADMMEDESYQLTPDQKVELTKNLSHSARNIYKLLENLLEWSQMQQGHTVFNPQLLDLNFVVNECLKIITETAKNKTIKIEVNIPPKMEVFADMNMLQIIIRNLVSNAIKFTPKGGDVSISANIGVDKIVEIAVKDNGIGMSYEMLDNLFRLDAKHSRPGTEGEPSTGLGLLLCKEFVEKNNGKLWVVSEEKKGSAFCFTIPAIN